MKLFDDLARLWWVRVPALLGRISGLLTSLASDGAYLRAWPAAAALAPIGCLLFGLLAGWTHFSNSYIALSYTNSLLLMALLTLISGLGGGLGLYLLIGYIFGDFLLFGHGEYMGAPSAQIMARLALPIAYLLLGKLLILAPVVSRGLRLQLLDKLRLSGTAGTIAHAAVQAALQAALVWVWVQAAPTLIRPIYTWRGGAPTSEAMAPLQESGMLLVALALLIGAVRVVIERLPAAQRAAADARRDLRQTRTGARALQPPRLPVWLAAALRSAFATYLLAGLIVTFLEGVLFFGLTLAGQLLRGMVATRLAPLSRLMARVPIVLRLVAGGLVSFALASLLVPLVWNSTQTFFPIMIPTATSMVVFALLMPATPLAPAPAGTTVEARS
ncbi:MAG TPA: hypothetical protein PLL45_18520 [Thermoflexales bacterium]|nr:hypothetical protein [Thermoflexales bacterium]HQY26880.1 hypothetical protein [Thermoflexales bacterium]HQZ57811.1 hypothetical protein [Ottowia sp.]HRB11050.1 hypothetical protein [Ottowia sp.]